MTSASEVVADNAETADPAAGRINRLSTRVRQVRTRGGTGSLDRGLLLAGAVLMPLGIVLILIGWAGASRTQLPYQQNDYLISGGLLGLGLVIAGGFTYFAYWQTVRIRESRRQALDLTQAIGRLEALLSEGSASGARPATAKTFVATAKGSIFHRSDCPTVIGRDDLSPVDAAATELKPCRICTPFDAG